MSYIAVVCRAMRKNGPLSTAQIGDITGMGGKVLARFVYLYRTQGYLVRLGTSPPYRYTAADDPPPKKVSGPKPRVVEAPTLPRVSSVFDLGPALLKEKK